MSIISKNKKLFAVLWLLFLCGGISFAVYSFGVIQQILIAIAVAVGLLFVIIAPYGVISLTFDAIKALFE